MGGRPEKKMVKKPKTPTLFEESGVLGFQKLDFPLQFNEPKTSTASPSQSNLGVEDQQQGSGQVNNRSGRNTWKDSRPWRDSKGQPTSKQNLCPICEKDHGCKTSDELILCFRKTSAQDAPKGYRFVKLLRENMGGLFAVGEQSEYDEQREERQQREREQKKAQRRAYVLQLPKIDERDRKYRAILRQRCTDLKPIHRADLIRRGLTENEIDWTIALGWVRSWQGGVKAPHGTDGVAGVDSKGNLVNVSGYAIAALDPQGRYTGAQIATLSDPKYKWLSSNLQGGFAPQLPNDELPLFCWRHPEAKEIKEVWLCEGALKSLVTAVLLWRSGRTNIAVIGTAAGANYGEKTLLQYLKDLGAKQIRLLPDAGAKDPKRKNIFLANQKTSELVQAHGYSLLVGWWGQTEKGTNPDIDELLALTSAGADLIDWISWKQYSVDGPIAPVAALREKQPTQEEQQEYADRGEEARWERKRQRQIGNLFVGKPLRAIADKFLKRFKKRAVRDAALAETLEKQRQTFWYSPGNLPNPEEYKKLGSPKVVFKACHRHQWVKEAREKGHKHNYDKSAAGSGKSHHAGLMTAEDLGTGKLWYYSSDHTNPTTETVERNFENLPPRHNGLVENPDRVTPLGQPHLNWPKDGEHPTTQGNCCKTWEFQLMASKGYYIEPGGENPICQRCPHGKEEERKDGKGRFIRCAHSTGPGWGFRKLRKEALQSALLRLHPASSPDPREMGEEGQSISVAAFWDEFSKLSDATSPLEVSLRDFDGKMADLEGKDPELHAALLPIRLALRPLLTREIQQPRYGWNHEQVLAHLDRPENIAELIERACASEPTLEEIFVSLKEEDGISRQKGVSARQHAFINEILGSEKSIKRLSDAYCLFLVPFLEILAGVKNGALAVKDGRLIIHRVNERIRELTGAIEMNVYMDATMSRSLLSLHIGVPEEEILWMEEEATNYSNLEIVHIDIDRHISGKNSVSLNKRLCAMGAQLRIDCPGIALLGHKALADSVEELELAGWWFNHNRGSNEFQDLQAIALLGTPYSNLGVLQAEYITLTGDTEVRRDAPGFARYQQEKVEAEIIQGVGRLRANRRQEQVIAYIISNYSPEFLEAAYPGCRIVQKQPWEITPHAGTIHQQNWWAISNAIQQMQERGGKITQQAIAKISGVAQSTISFLANGGLKKIIEIAIVNPYTTFDKICRALDANERLEVEALVTDYLPSVLEQDCTPEEMTQTLMDVRQAYGPKVFWAALQALPAQLKAKMSALLVSLLPRGAEVWQGLLEESPRNSPQCAF